MATPAGCTTAQVIDNLDPQGSGRLLVRCQVPGRDDPLELWARLSAPVAGHDRGFWFLPEIGDEVLVAFGQDRKECFVLGALWNGKDAPPGPPLPNNARKLLRSRNGLQVVFDDVAGHEQVVIQTPAGQRVTLADGPAAIVVEDSNGNRVVLTASGIEVQAAGRVSVNASQLELGAGLVTVNAGMARFSGVVQCDSLVTNSVVSASYTPGAGNVW